MRAFLQRLFVLAWIGCAVTLAFGIAEIVGAYLPGSPVTFTHKPWAAALPAGVIEAARGPAMSESERDELFRDLSSGQITVPPGASLTLKPPRRPLNFELPLVALGMAIILLAAQYLLLGSPMPSVLLRKTLQATPPVKQ